MMSLMGAMLLPPLLPTAATTLTKPHVVNVLPDTVLRQIELLPVLLALLVLSLTLFLAITSPPPPLRMLSVMTAQLPMLVLDVLPPWPITAFTNTLLLATLRRALSVLLDSTSARSVLASKVTRIHQPPILSAIGLAPVELDKPLVVSITSALV